MIPVEALQDIRTILVHGYPDSACADGLASALILRDAFPDAEVRFLVHGTPEYAALAASPGQIFCDVTPPEIRVSEFVDAGAIVLDHHKSARHVVEAFGEKGVYASPEEDPGVSGALLAHRVWVQVKRTSNSRLPDGWDHEGWSQLAELEEFIFYFASLIGVRDTWQKDSPLWGAACRLSATLLFFPPDDWLANNLEINKTLLAAKINAVGYELIRKRDADARKLADAAYRFVTPAGTRVAVVSSCHVSDAADLLLTEAKTSASLKVRSADTLVGSDAADLLAESSDLVVGFAYTVELQPSNERPRVAGRGPREAGGESEALVSEWRLPRLRLSFRSRGKFDCSEIARMLGGGGHAGAAGATVTARPDSLQPYAEAVRIVELFEEIRQEIGEP